MKQPNYDYKNYDKALLKQKERYKRRVESMLKTDKYRCYFLTFTFTEKTLEKTTQKTRLRAIKTFLNGQASDYVLNIDYGKKNNREHYHAIILSRYKTLVLSAYKYGFIEYDKLHDTLNKIYTERNYPTAERLTNHAFKETTRESKIIYSRQAKPKRAITIKANKQLKAYHESATGKANKRIAKAILRENKKALYESIKERQNIADDYEII